MINLNLNLIIEDDLSEAVAKKILKEASSCYKVQNSQPWGKSKIISKIDDLNNAAKGYTYFILTDQDSPDRCPPIAINELRSPVHRNLLYRFAVMEIESWVMAHREAISRFLSVPLNRIPMDTDTILRPKECLINVARRSRSSNVKRDIVPEIGSTAKKGPDYNGRLIEFISEHWDVKTASQCSPSLKRTFQRLVDFAAEFSQM